MAKSCPVKTDKSWINLVSKVGEKEAYNQFFDNNYQIPDSIKQETKQEVLSKIDSHLVQFLKESGIKTEFYDSLKQKLGVDAKGALDTINKLVMVSRGEMDKSTIPEEVGHVIIEGLGVAHPLVKTLLSELKKTDFQSKLDPKYLELYKDNIDAQLHELAGQMIGEQIVKKGEGQSLISKIINKFLSFFKASSQIRLDEATKELANLPFEGKQVDLRDFKSPVGVLYQINAESPKIKETKSGVIDENKATVSLFKNTIQRLENELNKEFDPQKKAYLDRIKAKLAQFKKNNSKVTLTQLAKDDLSSIENFINLLKDKKKDITDFNRDMISDIYTKLKVLSNFSGVAKEALDLKREFEPFLIDLNKKLIQDSHIKGEAITQKEIDEKQKDIRRDTKWLGDISQIPNYISRTVSTLVRNEQSSISRQDTAIKKVIKEQVDKLFKFQESRGVSQKDSYLLFIQAVKGGKATILTNRYTSEWLDLVDKYLSDNQGEDVEKRIIAKKWLSKHYNSEGELAPKESELPKYLNKDYDTIQNTPALKEFYDFHKQMVKEGLAKLPIKKGEDFLYNVREDLLESILKNGSNKMSLLKDSIFSMFGYKMHIEDEYDNSDDLHSDVVPLSGIRDLGADVKSTDLGSSLQLFMQFSNNYEGMSKVLPQVRILQDQLASRNFETSSSGKDIIGRETNLYSIIDSFIEMQVKGVKKKTEGKFSWESVDEDGNQVTKSIETTAILDTLLSYNSILRIGLNPFTAITNVLVGETNNLIEGIGGRFLTVGGLNKATLVFFKQIKDKHSKLNVLMELFKPLMHLEEYANPEEVAAKKNWMTWDKVKNKMYAFQGSGELFMQSRTMIAMMYKDKLVDKDGKKIDMWDAFKEDGSWDTEKMGRELTQKEIDRYTNKVQEVNKMTHGRYSQKDATQLSQFVLFRLVSQFRKFIPAAVEARFGQLKNNESLGVETEGRYNTMAKLMVKTLKGNLKKLENGEYLTELQKYNMKKNAAEAIIVTSLFLLAHIIKGQVGNGQDDWKKNPYMKLALGQLNRMSGDLMLFMSPKQTIQMAEGVFTLTKLFKDLITTIGYIPDALGGPKSTFNSGYRKGENKFWANFFGMTPVLKNIQDVTRLNNGTKFNMTQL